MHSSYNDLPASVQWRKIIDLMVLCCCRYGCCYAPLSANCCNYCIIFIFLVMVNCKIFTGRKKNIVDFSCNTLEFKQIDEICGKFIHAIWFNLILGFPTKTISHMCTYQLIHNYRLLIISCMCRIKCENNTISYIFIHRHRHRHRHHLL